MSEERAWGKQNLHAGAESQGKHPGTGPLLQQRGTDSGDRMRTQLGRELAGWEGQDQPGGGGAWTLHWRTVRDPGRGSAMKWPLWFVFPKVEAVAAWRIVPEKRQQAGLNGSGGFGW